MKLKNFIVKLKRRNKFIRSKVGRGKRLLILTGLGFFSAILFQNIFSVSGLNHWFAYPFVVLALLIFYYKHYYEYLKKKEKRKKK